MSPEEIRAAAELAYKATAYDNVRAPIGSRDWLIFWQGWQARGDLSAQSGGPNNIRDAGPSAFGGRNAGTRRDD